ncbi:hypothetical protein HJ140_15770 [Vibrio parahaemolyticus]|uniref:hypothetical protein n=1 Tax=Vibrio TaxID=662 RepID=UPI001A1F254E|nr:MULTISPECIES: hypothetical protein [Vibrio]MBE3971171.1 hypothetical protein [Vibrio parahaemolyticus]ELY5144878.1 hypothetical protein [Vibrio vulnificus]MCA0781373.1 hypothetical protein [Vibrio vulnificus]MCF8778790.1 hypothetical protein [Vibrio floridensis]HAS6222200.1 hypothetical protein [Vibrio vulnificus]
MEAKEMWRIVLNWKTAFFSIVLVLIAIALLWVSQVYKNSAPIFLGIVLPSFASVLASSGVFALIYEVFIRQAQTKFVLESIELKESMLGAGLADVTVNYLDFDYAKEINNAKSIRVFVLYAHSWLNRYSVEVSNHMRQDNSSLILVIPKFENRFLKPLTEHFQYTDDQMKDKIGESVGSVVSQAIRGSLGKGSQLQVYMHGSRPCYSMYEFDDKLLVGTYYASHSRRRSPMFLFSDKPNSMYSEFNDDLNQVIANDSELIYCSSSGICKITETLGEHVPLELQRVLHAKKT